MHDNIILQIKTNVFVFAFQYTAELVGYSYSFTYSAQKKNKKQMFNSFILLPFNIQMMVVPYRRKSVWAVVSNYRRSVLSPRLMQVELVGLVIYFGLILIHRDPALIWAQHKEINFVWLLN